jgi:Rhs element Vgr protein
VSSPSVIPTPATPDVCTLAILVEGKEISGEYQVMSVTVARELNRIPTATLHLRDGEASKALFAASDTDLFIPGRKIEIRLGYRSQNDPVFTGIIVKHSIKIRQHGSVLLVECRDEAVKMTQGRKSRYFSDTRDSDIMEDILGSHGLQKDVERTTPEVKDVVQYDSTDWDFLLCRAEANGQVVMVRDGKVKTGSPATGQEPVVSVQYGATMLEFDAEIDARCQGKGITAKSWNAADQEVIDAEGQEPAATNDGNLSPASLADAMGSEEQLIRHGGRISQPELQAWADARLMKERLAKVRGRAKFQGLADVVPGTIIEVKGVGERFEGRLYVSGVRHAVLDGNWETDVQFGLNPELFAETYNMRPLPASGLVPAVGGLQIGIVTVLENDPDGEDRIKVRLPLVSTQDEGAWARIATLDAGKERGTFFRPEIGDEVVMGFLGDDPRHPVVIGMCHSSAKPAPEPPKDANHRKGYVSRASMRLTFDDEKKIVVLETPAGNRLTLSEDAKAVTIEDQNGNSIRLEQGGITIESSKDLKLKAPGDVTIEGANTELKAASAFKASGTGSAEVSGASTTIQGSASTVIKGGMVQIN